MICELQNKKHNDIPRTLQFMPYDLLRAIGRGTSGSQYQRLKEGLYRLRNTSIETNMAWWNGLSVRDRAAWMKRAGDTGVVADAWAAAKALGGAEE